MKALYILSLLIILFQPLNYSMGAEEFTRAGRSLEEIYRLHGSRSYLVRMNLQHGKWDEEIFLIEPIKFHIRDALFKDCSFIRIFSTESISHYIHAYAVASSKTKMTWLTNDEETVSFLQTVQNEITTEAALIQYVSVFASLRSYDILTEKPNLLKKDEVEVYNIPSDLVWGVFPYKTKKEEIRCTLTVVVNVYAYVICKYEFGLTDEKKIMLIKKEDVYKYFSPR